MKRKRAVPQNTKLNYNCRREERKEARVEAENRDEGLQGPSFRSKKQEMVEREKGLSVYRLPLLENRETNGETGQYLSNTYFFGFITPSFLQKPI